ncbi:hypothetical protein M422DRAFT_226909 [Sphaerobolus stellatus SS14]|uniref:NACHT domain-containing protein n=1 Tax=Sphaerobolus stellatus (strain SS14) TaxID=990650 RepID=A0A0C9W3R3_SPHS4|nr:hypothetical protein M422DRAFT_226909 [Sphaerobolus stellatus SS14]
MSSNRPFEVMASNNPKSNKAGNRDLRIGSFKSSTSTAQQSSDLSKDLRGERKRDKFLKPFKNLLSRSSSSALNRDVQAKGSKEPLTDQTTELPKPDNDTGPGEQPEPQLPAEYSQESEIEPDIGKSLQNLEINLDTRGAIHDTKEQISTMQEIDSTALFSKVISKLNYFSEIVSEIAEIHPYAKMAVKVLFFAIDTIKKQMDLDENIHNAVDLLDRVYSFVETADGEYLKEHQSGILKQLSITTIHLAHFISDYARNKDRWLRTLKNFAGSVNSQITAYQKAFDDLIKDFRDHSMVHTQRNSSRILENTLCILDHLEDLYDDIDLSSLQYASGATGYDTSKQCLPNTRIEILDEIFQWLNDPREGIRPVFWLTGGAGTGKSTIANTVARRFHELGRLGCCFSFDARFIHERRHEKIFSTILRDMADLHPAIRKTVATLIHKSPMSLRTTSDTMRQWNDLLLKTLALLSDDESTFSTLLIGPILIIIDALDETGDDSNTRRQLLSVLQGGQGGVERLPSNFRILLTSRPLKDVNNALQGSTFGYLRSMDQVSPEYTEADISTYITSRLYDTLGPFLTRNRAIALAKRADRLFQWAFLACEYIIGNMDFGLLPEERFEDLCSISSSGQASGDKLLYSLYYKVLKSLFPNIQNPRVRTRFQSVIGHILVTAEPLSRHSLNVMRDHFPGLPQQDKDIAAVVDGMGSLLTGISDPLIPIQPIHTSFYEFLTSKENSKEFYVDSNLMHGPLAFSSLKVMLQKDGLRFNIANINSSYLRNVDLDIATVNMIPHHLVYACKYWTSHLRYTKPSGELVAMVRKLLFKCFPYWLEVLSLTAWVNKSVKALSIIISWLKEYPSTGNNDVTNFATDAQKFVRMFGGPIVQSAPHIYVSALPFAPKQSLINKEYASKLLRELSLSDGFMDVWPPLEFELTPESSESWAVTFSPDGAFIAFGSTAGILEIMDAETGEQHHSFEGHDDHISSITYSSDGTYLASCSEDQTIRTWDAMTGEELQVFIGHSDAIHCIAFSPESTHIISGSSDMTIRIWDTRTGKELQLLKGHSDQVRSVAYSIDNIHIVSGSVDKTVRIWDARASKCLCILEDHTQTVTSVAFSPDGSQVASGSMDQTIRIWETYTGGKLQILEGHSHGVCCIAFSPNGLHIASEFLRLEGHSGSILSVTFSFDGLYIASGGSDTTVRLWDASTAKTLHIMEGHNDAVTSTTFSPDATHIMSGSADKTIRIWNARTGEALHSFQAHFEHDGWVTGPHGRLLFWVPPLLRKGLHLPGTQMIIGHPRTVIDLNNFSHGKSWINCFKEEFEEE